MKSKIVVVLAALIFLLFAHQCFSTDIPSAVAKNADCSQSDINTEKSDKQISNGLKEKQKPKTGYNDDSKMDDSNSILLAGRGCCSWHGGECGCDDATGRTICCDGTLSPSCRCD